MASVFWLQGDVCLEALPSMSRGKTEVSPSGQPMTATFSVLRASLTATLKHRESVTIFALDSSYGAYPIGGAVDFSGQTKSAMSPMLA
jgi:hypothetical protein